MKFTSIHEADIVTIVATIYQESDCFAFKLNDGSTHQGYKTYEDAAVAMQTLIGLRSRHSKFQSVWDLAHAITRSKVENLQRELEIVKG